MKHLSLKKLDIKLYIKTLICINSILVFSVKIECDRIENIRVSKYHISPYTRSSLLVSFSFDTKICELKQHGEHIIGNASLDKNLSLDMIS